MRQSRIESFGHAAVDRGVQEGFGDLFRSESDVEGSVDVYVELGSQPPGAVNMPSVTSWRSRGESPGRT